MALVLLSQGHWWVLAFFVVPVLIVIGAAIEGDWRAKKEREAFEKMMRERRAPRHPLGW